MNPFTELLVQICLVLLAILLAAYPGAAEAKDLAGNRRAALREATTCRASTTSSRVCS